MLLAISINHKTAPIALREKVSFPANSLTQILLEAKQQLRLSELVILSTCNRTELYVCTRYGAAPVLSWLERFHSLYPQTLIPYSRLYHNSAAVKHILKVACGLDSMVLGEPQILGQLKQAHAVAKKASTTGSVLEKLLQHSFSVAKQVRTQTDIGKNPVSIAFAAVTLAKQIFTSLDDAKILLIGAGETIELVTRHLKERGASSLTVANRTLETAKQLANRFAATACLLTDISTHLEKVDIVITSTASQLPIIGKGAMESALKKRRYRPLLILDLAVPRDIEPEIGELSDVYLYTIDDLKQVVEENVQGRQEAAGQAELLIESGVEDFIQQMRSLDAVKLLRNYRDVNARIRDEELAKCLKRLENGADPALLLQYLARNLTNKMMHNPSIALKKAGAQGQTEAFKWARQLLGLDQNLP